MSRNSNYVYNKTHFICVFDRRGIAEERNINISITDLGDSLVRIQKKSLEIKL